MNTRTTIGSVYEETAGTPGNPIRHHADDQVGDDGTVATPGNPINHSHEHPLEYEMVATPGNPVHHSDDHTHRDAMLATPGNPIPDADHDHGDTPHDHHHELGYN